MPEKPPPQDLLDWLRIRSAPDWGVARPLGPFFSVVLVLLFAFALVAAFVLLGCTFLSIESVSGLCDKPGAGLGTGALIVAILGAPFLIWGTVLKHQTVRYQKEGHITDRINKAVEQLGVEKEVKRIGRNVVIRTNRPEGYEERADLFVFKGEQFSISDGDKIDEGSWETVALTEPNIEVRIGAILSLERIAQDSTRYDNGRDHVRVMEILCA